MSKRWLIPLMIFPAICLAAPAPPERSWQSTSQVEEAIARLDRRTQRVKHVDRAEIRHIAGKARGVFRSLKGEEAQHLADLVRLLEGLHPEHPLGQPRTVLEQASLQGKYSVLQHVLTAPGDAPFWGRKPEHGYWNGTIYQMQEGLRPGYWVYVKPRWFVWKNCRGEVDHGPGWKD